MENDLISRSALIAYVKELPTYDATDRGFIFRRYPSGLFAPDDIVKSIQCAPAVDAVEVVRCKDCKHFLTEIGVTYCDYHTTHACDDDGYCDGVCGVYEDDFCSYGERRTDDGR